MYKRTSDKEELGMVAADAAIYDLSGQDGGVW
jgi:hypothetical protein